MASVGVHGALGPLEFVIAPQFFRTQNADFPLEPNGFTGPTAFADARNPNEIDLPQRFGNAPYQRLDAGQSAVSLSLFHFTLGASTANEGWGPAIDNPFLLGNNAAGFAHLFAGTDGPVSLGPLTFGVRIIAGRLEQSAFSLAAYAARRRSLAGLTAVFGLRQFPGLEIGFGRVFEDVYPESGVRLGDILRPLLEGILKSQRARTLGNGSGTDAANQLASLFARWAVPSAGLEVYGELGREDHSYDLRDLILEPDHDLAYSIGLQRAWRRAGGAMLAVRGELMSTGISHLARVRAQAPPYVHTFIRQGHTQRGQLLGAPAGYGGGATAVVVDWITPAGRRSLTWRRLLREPKASTTEPRDVIHAISADWLIFRSRVDLTPELTAAYNLNRNGGGDALGLRLALTGAAHW